MKTKEFTLCFRVIHLELSSPVQHCTADRHCLNSYRDITLGIPGVNMVSKLVLNNWENAGNYFIMSAVLHSS